MRSNIVHQTIAEDLANAEQPTQPANYSDHTAEQLRDELRARGLPTSGNKTELLQRLADSTGA